MCRAKERQWDSARVRVYGYILYKFFFARSTQDRSFRQFTSGKAQQKAKNINMNTNSIMLYLFKNLVAYLRVKCAEYNQGESSKTATEICFRIRLSKMCVNGEGKQACVYAKINVCSVGSATFLHGIKIVCCYVIVAISLSLKGCKRFFSFVYRSEVNLSFCLFWSVENWV